MLNHMGEERGFKDEDDDEGKNRFLSQFMYTVYSLKNTPYGPLVPELRQSPLCTCILDSDISGLQEAMKSLPRALPHQIPKEASFYLKKRGYFILLGYLGYPIEAKVFTKFNLSALHVAAITGNQIAVTLLLAAGFDPEPQDIRGWTPRHHAAVLGQKEIYSILKQRAFFDPLNAFRGTAEDLLQMVRPIRNGEVRVWNHRDKKVDHYPFSAIFKEKEVVAFCDDVHATGFTLLNEWYNPEKPPFQIATGSHQELVFIGYDSMKANPKTAIDISPKNDRGEALSASIGKGLVATDYLFSGDLICEFGGMHMGSYMAPKEEGCEHRIGHISTYHVRSSGSLALDSHPNAKVLSMCWRGTYRFVIVAIETILPGENITYNYLVHPIKDPEVLHIEVRPKAFTEFWSSKRIQEYLKKGVPDQLLLSTRWEAESICYRLNYPFFTLRAYYELVLSKIVTNKDFFGLQKYPRLALRHTFFPTAALALENACHKFSKAKGFQIKKLLQVLSEVPFQEVFDLLFSEFDGEKKRDDFFAFLKKRQIELSRVEIGHFHEFLFS